MGGLFVIRKPKTETIACNMKNSIKGFRLLDLLAVIAIIGIVISMVYDMSR